MLTCLRFPSSTRLGDVSASTARIEGDDLKLSWNEGPVAESHFDAQFLRTYANIVAKPVDAAPEEVEGDFFDFLDQNRGMKREDVTLWGNDDSFKVHTYDYNELDSKHNDLMKSLMNPGFVIVENMPQDPKFDGTGLSTFASKYLGGLQKHPLRESAHWTISTEATTHDDSNMLADENLRKGANSYNTSQQLCNHTDQSLYGLPGILLGFHCAMGEGNNSLTDGFAAAYALKDRHPEEYKLLTTLGMNAGRRLEYYNANDLHFNTQHKVLHEDADGNLMRVQYHEIYRTPSTLSFEDFPKYFNALKTFYNIVHSPEFQVGIKLQAGQCLMMNNWRTMHGRAGLAGKKRTILGGTVTREAFYSQVRRLRQEELNINPDLECGLPVTYYKTLANSK